MKRYLEPFILEDIEEKMVFVGGPRQVGKTTMALNLLNNGSTHHPAYLSWDNFNTKKALLDGALPSGEPLIVLDEIHKFKGWRNLIKGFYDRLKDSTKFCVTGSARLDYYRRGGDSLQGRYHYHRLHPLSLYELNSAPTKSDLEHMMEFGGFPEPCLKGNRRHYKRWQKEHRSRVIQEDILNMEQVREFGQMELLSQILPDRVGSPLSINNLRQDLRVAFETAERWITIFENLYHCFRIAPLGFPPLRMALKEKKLYMWDWSLCQDPAIRFENLVASMLLKYCHHHEDWEGETMSLHFMRDARRREIDFVVVKNGEPLFAVECKSGERKLSKNIPYFAPRTDIPTFYQVHMGERDVEYPHHHARLLPLTTLATMLKI